MELLCPSCQATMEAATEPRAQGRQRFYCPRCEGEYLTSPRKDPIRLQAEELAPSAPAPGPGETTLPGFTVAGIPAGQWELPEELRFTLKVLEGTEAGKSYEVTRSRVTVGREEGDLLVGDPLVSRKHAAFEIYGSQHIVVKDLASTNGTYLNGRLIAYSKLNHGDKIRIGSTVLEAVILIEG